MQTCPHGPVQTDLSARIRPYGTRTDVLVQTSSHRWICSDGPVWTDSYGWTRTHALAQTHSYIPVLWRPPRWWVWLYISGEAALWSASLCTEEPRASPSGSDELVSEPVKQQTHKKSYGASQNKLKTDARVKAEILPVWLYKVQTC